MRKQRELANKRLKLYDQERVGILVGKLGVAMGAGLAWGSTGNSEPIWRGPVAVALGRLQHKY